MDEDTKQIHVDEDIEIHADIEGLELYSEQYPFRLPLKIRDFDSEQEFKKFIRSCEKMVRGSIEYKYWRDYIKDVLGVNMCMITQERMDECTIEVHHHIPSLYSLIKSMINRKIEREEEFSSFDISTEAIELHYKNKVGYVTLIKSMHEKFHNACLSIPINLVKGDYQFFMDNLSRYLDSDEIDVLTHRLSIDQTNCHWTRGVYPEQQAIGDD